MSRFSVGAACALLTLVGLALSARLGAQEEGNSRDVVASQTMLPYHRIAKNAEDRIEAVLDGRLKAPMEFLDIPLADVMTQIADEYEIPIQFNNAALDEIAISTDTEITLATLQNVSLRTALNIMFKQPGLEDLTYVVEDEVLMITTEERANGTLRIHVYRVDDLDWGVNRSSSKENYYSSLPQVIVSVVEVDSWQENNTGEGTILIMEPGVLVVSQTRRVHQKIGELLDDLRDTIAEIEGASGGL